MTSNRRRVVCEWVGGNRTVSPWYATHDPRFAWFLRNTDGMVWIRVEEQHGAA